MNILQDIFVYFARYVTPDVVDRFFTKASGDEDYSRLRTRARAAAEGRFPELTDYIFGVQEESVTRRIGQVKGVYLFVDYGGITSSEDLRNVKSDDFSLAVTVARPMSSAALDMADELLVSDRLLRIIAAIRDDMRSDDSDSFIRRMLFPNDITPFYARELSNSYGWTLMFKMRGVDWI
jgi:hypothetical protein